jgi:hypothetical protein
MMSIATFDEGINYIRDFIKKSGSEYQGWYVGITKDIDERLFGYHRVDRQNGFWCYIQAKSSTIARDIEKFFTEGCHTDGGPGGGDDDSDIVYAYKKGFYTVEREA